MKTHIATLSLISILLTLSACGKKEVEAPTPEAVTPTTTETVVADITAEAEVMVEAAQAEAEAIVEEAQAEVEAIVESAQAEVQDAISGVTVKAEAQVDAIKKEAEAKLADAVVNQATDSAKEEASKSLKSLIPKF